MGAIDVHNIKIKRLLSYKLGESRKMFFLNFLKWF